MLNLYRYPENTLFDVPNYITEREKATPAVGIKFKFEKKVFKNSTR